MAVLSGTALVPQRLCCVLGDRRTSNQRGARSDLMPSDLPTECSATPSVSSHRVGTGTEEAEKSKMMIVPGVCDGRVDEKLHV